MELHREAQCGAPPGGPVWSSIGRPSVELHQEYLYGLLNGQLIIFKGTVPDVFLKGAVPVWPVPR